MKKRRPTRKRRKKASLLKTRDKEGGIRLRIKVSPRLQWILPFIKKAKEMMPSLIMPTQIRSFKPVKNKIMRVLGNVYFETRIIVLATHTQQTYVSKTGRVKVKKIIAISRSEILDTLAHELAHMRYPDHNYEHEEYTRTIFKTFGVTQKCVHCKGSGKVPMEIKT